jgi:hypothetical protein
MRQWVWEDQEMSGDPMDLELASTAILADAHDTRELLKLLARQLAGTLGERVRVQREGGLLHRSDEVKNLVVTIDNEEFTATADRARVETSICHSSGGIRIRSEKVAADVWLTRLLEALRKEATTNQSARMAIEGLVMGSE